MSPVSRPRSAAISVSVFAIPATRFAGCRAPGFDRRLRDLLGARLRAVGHDLVDHLRAEVRVVDRARLDRASLHVCTTRNYDHFFTTYFERACLRSATPPASSAARMV